MSTSHSDLRFSCQPRVSMLSTHFLHRSQAGLASQQILRHYTELQSFSLSPPIDTSRASITPQFFSPISSAKSLTICTILTPSPSGIPHPTTSTLPLLLYPHFSYNATPLNVAPISSLSKPPITPALPSLARASQYRIIIVPNPRRAYDGCVKMARILARSMAGLRFAGIRRGEGAVDAP
jgi:hypothetical protein